MENKVEKFNERKILKDLMDKYHIIYYANCYYVYQNGYYMRKKENQMKTDLKAMLKQEFKSMANVNKLYESLKTEIGVYIEENDPRIESSEWINFKNCLYNPYTGMTKEHTPDIIYFTQRPFDYNPLVEPDELTDKFFNNCVVAYDGEEKEKALELLYQTIGVTISSIRPKNFVFIHGRKKDTSKSSYCGVIQRLLGDGNYSAVPIENIREDRFFLTPMIGMPANIVTETSPVELREAQITTLKKITGGAEETVFIDMKGLPAIEVKLKTFLLFAGNNIPDIWNKGNMDAFLERMIPIHFNGQISEEDKILNIVDKLNYEYIIIKAMKALKRFIDNNYVFTMPQDVLNKRKEIKNSNPINSFIEDCDFSDPEYKIHCKTLFDIFTRWSIDNGCPTNITNIGFNKQMENNNIYKAPGKVKETEGKKQAYVGFIGVKPPKEYLDEYLKGWGTIQNSIK